MASADRSAMPAGVPLATRVRTQRSTAQRRPWPFVAFRAALPQSARAVMPGSRCMLGLLLVVRRCGLGGDGRNRGRLWIQAQQLGGQVLARLSGKHAIHEPRRQVFGPLRDRRRGDANCCCSG